MKFDNFSIRADPIIQNAYCKCGKELQEVSNGLFSSAFYCVKCESVYMLKMIKVNKKKLSKEYIDQCRNEIKQRTTATMRK